MPEKKGDRSVAEQRIASILPLPSKIKIEIGLKNHELFKIVLHILGAGGGREETDQKPTVSTALAVVRNWSWASSFVRIYPVTSSSPCKSIPSVHSSPSPIYHSLYAGSKCSRFFLPFKTEAKAVSVSETFFLFPIPSWQRGEHWAHSPQRGEEVFYTAVFHRLQTWACSTPGNKVRNQTSFDSPGGWRWHHLSRHPAPGLSHVHCGNHCPWMEFAAVAPPLTLQLWEVPAPSPLYLPRKQIPMSQPFPLLLLPGCTTLGPTDPLSPRVFPPPHLTPRTARCSPRAPTGGKDHFHHHPGAQEHSLGRGCLQESTTGSCSHMQNPRDHPTAPPSPSHFTQATVWDFQTPRLSVKYVLNTLKLPWHLWSVWTFPMSSRKGRTGQIYKSIFISIQLEHFSWKLYFSLSWLPHKNFSCWRQLWNLSIHP